MPRFQDIVPFTRSAGYACDHSWPFLPDFVANEVLEGGLDLNPDFQRGHVWTTEQKIRYVEYILRGGLSGRDIYLNCPGFRFGRVGRQWGNEGHYVLVDGKQRLDAVFGFMNNEFPIFEGHFYRDFTDKMDLLVARFRWHVNDLQTREEVLQWYLDLNSGGTVHSDDELNRVRKLLAEKAPYEPPTQEETEQTAGLHREIFQRAVTETRAKLARRELADKEPKPEAPKTTKKGKKK